MTNIFDPCFDLISTAQQLWRHSPLHWKTHHIIGHQDEGPSVNLDIYAKLNIEMDEMAKMHLRTAQQSPRHFFTINEPWSVWVDNYKLTSELDKVLYELVHAPLARSYWANKQQIDEEVIQDVNWPAIGKAADSSPLSKHIFIMKHSAGMCGVGKFMARWKQRESPDCPRCGDFEDASHVRRCHGSGADQIWLQSLEGFKVWMDKQDTDPDLSTLLIDMLQAWRTESAFHGNVPYGLNLLEIRQSELGGQALLEGQLSFEWEASQQAYLTFIKSRKTGKCWVVQLIQRLWDIAWELWEHRNGILNEQTNHVDRHYPLTFLLCISGYVYL